MTYADFISKRILQLIDERKWSVRLVATLSGLPYSTVNKIVLKERANPSVLTVHSIAMAFDMDVVDFLNCPEIRNLTSEELRRMRQQANPKNK